MQRAYDRPIAENEMPDDEQRGDRDERHAVESILRGDTEAYDYLVDRYMRRVLSIAWGIARNAADAEDLAQEAFVRAYRTLHRFRTDQPFGPWIYRIVTNLALDLLKHRRRSPQPRELDTEQPAGHRDDADLAAASGEISRRIDRAIESLPEMQRIVVRLHLVEDFGHQEIAAMTSLSEGTVRSHLSLGRKKLQQMLSDLHGGRS
ncbi:MAG TPA: sigma-70 family RNA polymerase sigma factor [Thermoanaerobaculia bacterium]|nr:sigma-70 family RNA polymerase sigma factor [Thermoanaerobaculia bacterium]